LIGLSIHAIFISNRPFKNATGGGLEVKANKLLTFVSPSKHKDGNTYTAFDTEQIAIIDNVGQMRIENRIAAVIPSYLSEAQTNEYIKYLELDNTILHEGERHNAILAIANSYFFRYNGNWSDLTDEQRFDKLVEYDRKHCVPSLYETPSRREEFKRIWVDVCQKFGSKRQQERQSRENNKEGVSIVKEASKNIMEKYRFVTIEESKEIRVFDNGVYIPGGEILIEKEAERLYNYDLKLKDLTEIKGHIMRQTYHKLEEFDSNLYIKNMKNGLYNFKTKECTDHTPDYLSLIQTPIIYNPDAKSKEFGIFLKQVLYPSEIRTAVEMIAYTFYNSNPYEIINILLGYGSNGKGVFTGLITALHGSKSISNVPLKQLTDNPFAVSDLENKAANIDSELSSGVILDPSMLKRLTGRQAVRIERKNARAYDTLLHAKLFLSANKIPQTADESDGYYRRNVMITFPNKFEGKADDPDKLDKLTTEEELSGIFNVLMIALRRIIFGATDKAKTKGVFVNSRTIQQRREKYERATNPIKAFMSEAISPESTLDDKIYKDSLYQAYIRYCNELTLPFVSKENFGKVIKKDPYHIQDGRDTKEPRERFWKSIKLLKMWDIDRRQTTIVLEEIPSESWRGGV
jgi:P4 family phage/plasmid primase-like protien